MDSTSVFPGMLPLDHEHDAKLADCMSKPERDRSHQAAPRERYGNGKKPVHGPGSQHDRYPKGAIAD